MAQAIQCGGAENAVAGEGLAPFAEVEIAGEDRRCVLVAFCDQVVEVFILWRTQRLEREVVNDEDRYAGELSELALVGASSACGLQAAQ